MNNTEKQLKFILYCRKSSEQEDRQILSLPAQEKELLTYATRENLKIIDIYKESKSAHTAGRTHFNEMVQRIEKKEANGILVWDESRIARNSKDGGMIVYMMDLEQIVEIRKPGKIYRNTPDDKSWLQMNFMMSKKESDDKSVNTRRGLRTKAEKGWFPSSFSKPGYMWDRFSERGNKILLNDPIRFPLMKQCWELMVTGAYTVPQLCRKLNTEWGYKSPVRKTMGGKSMARSQLYTLFGDPFYYGYYEYKDSSGVKQWIKGNHEPMVSKEEFNRVQILLGRGCRQKKTKHEFSLTGIIRCGECNAMVTAEEKWQVICGNSNCKNKFNANNRDFCPKCEVKIKDMTNAKVLHYIYYHCSKRINPNCTQKSIRAEKLEKQVDEILKNIHISERFKDWALKYLNKLNDEEVTTRTATVSSLQSAYNDCLKKLDNLVALKISPQNSDNSLLTDEEFKSRKIGIMAEKTALEEQMENQGKRITNWVETVERNFDFAIHARYKFQTGAPEMKREILVTIGSNIRLFKDLLCPDLKNDYGFLEEATEAEPTISYEFETPEQIDNPSQFEQLWAENPTLLRD